MLFAHLSNLWATVAPVAVPVAITAGLLYILFYGTFIFYTSFMHIKQYRVSLEKGAPGLLKGMYPIFIVALLMDVLFNLVIGTIYYRELPKVFDKEWLFTARCQRHLKGQGIQLLRAQYVCGLLLDPFDRGHCA